MGFGDRPIYPLAAQRLDKVDIEAISELVETSMMRMWASVMGPSSGLLTDVALSYDTTTKRLSIGACRLGYVYYEQLALEQNLGTGLGGVIRYDPDFGVGSTDVDLTTFVDSTCWVFFKRLPVPADEENRAYWDAVAQQKKVGVTNTRLREGCVFVASANKDDFAFGVEDGWFPFLYVSGWVGTPKVPAVIKVHYFESGQYDGEEYGLLFQRSGTKPANIPHTGIGEVADTTGYMVGQAQFNRRVLAQLCRMMDSDWVTTAAGAVTTAGAVGWNSAPNRGLTQLDAAVDEYAERIEALENQVPCVLFTGLVTFDGINQYEIDTTYKVRTETITLYSDNSSPYLEIATSAYGAGYKASITIRDLPTDWVVLGVSVTPASGVTTSDPTDEWRMTRVSYTTNLPFEGNGTLDFTFVVAHTYGTDPENEDFSFIIYGKTGHRA